MNKHVSKGALDAQYASLRQKKGSLRFRLHVRAAMVVHTIRTHAPQAPVRLLDLGCAEGRTLRAISGRLPLCKCVGVEYSSELLETAGALPDHITLMQGDATCLPRAIEASSFDVVSALALLEHLKEPEKAVREAYKVLKPGGFLVASSPVPAWDHVSHKLGLLKEDHHEVDMTKAKMQALLCNGGFERLAYRKFMWAPIAFLPYLRIPVSPSFSVQADLWIEKLKLFNALFVNQVVVGGKPRAAS